MATSSKNKLAQELTPEQLQAFLEELAGVPRGEQVERIQELAEKHGINIGKSSAYNFRERELGPYLDRLRKRKELASAITEIGLDDSGMTLADAAAAELSQLSFDFITELDGQLDLTSKQGLNVYKALTNGLASLRKGDRDLIKQQSKMIEETKADLQDKTLTEEQRAARMRERFGV